VIHAAGVAGGGIIPLKTRDAAERVLAPKVFGLAALHTALGDAPLDFVALCSSMNSILGGAGQVDYCAANAFLDAFAHAQNRAGRRTIAINWSAWQEVGMAVNTAVPGHLVAARDANLKHGIRSSEGQETFRRILANPLPQVAVSPQDLPTVIRWYEQLQDRIAGTVAGSLEAAQASDQYASAVLHARPQVTATYEGPRSDVEEQLVEIWQGLLGIERIGIHDNFFELGGHSLLATQVVARVQRSLGVEVALRTLFEASTIAELAERVEMILWAAQSKHDAGFATAGERVEIEL
jgi:acyl carrier protein